MTLGVTIVLTYSWRKTMSPYDRMLSYHYDGMSISIDDVTYSFTIMSPEEYNVIKDGKLVGYIDLRQDCHVDVPTKAGRPIYYDECDSINISENLVKAVEAIHKYLASPECRKDRERNPNWFNIELKED